MKSNLPLIRLSAINPFLLELHRRGANPASLLESLGLPLDIPASNELFVASSAIYEFVERSAEVAGDRYLGFAIGRALDLQDWAPIAKSANEANTVGELLTGFTIHAAEHSSATKFYLKTVGDRSTFGFERLGEPTDIPGQNDAFYMGFMSRIFVHATRDHWDASKVLFRVADPDCVPKTMEPYQISKGDCSGIQIKFPSAWLFVSFRISHFRSAGVESARASVPSTLLDGVRAALTPHLDETDLSVDKAAKICGYNRRRLASQLRQEGTSLSNEIAKLRAQKAEQCLAESNRPVSEIAEAVGFTDPTSFSRAFKNWTGQSPQKYRRNHKSLT